MADSNKMVQHIKAVFPKIDIYHTIIQYGMMMSSETKNQVQMISQTILVEAWRVRVLQVSYVLEGEQICVIQFSSAITILRLKEQIQNKHKKSLKFILMRCFTCSEENKFVSFIFLLQSQFSFKRANPKQTRKIAYIYTHELFCMIGGETIGAFIFSAISILLQIQIQNTENHLYWRHFVIRRFPSVMCIVTVHRKWLHYTYTDIWIEWCHHERRWRN